MKYRKWAVNLVALLAFILLTVIDQVSKLVIVEKIPERGDISVINKVLKIVYVQNTGAAGGLVLNGSVLLCVLLFSCFSG